MGSGLWLPNYGLYNNWQLYIEDDLTLALFIKVFIYYF